MSQVIDLGQCLNEDIYKLSANKCIEDFNQQHIMLLLTLIIPIHMLKMFFFANIV